MALGTGRKGGGAPRGNKNAAGPHKGFARFKSTAGKSLKIAAAGGVVYAYKAAKDSAREKASESMQELASNIAYNAANQKALDQKNGLASSKGNSY